MRNTTVLVALAVCCATQAQAGTSLSISGLADSQDGTAFDADIGFSPTGSWSLGAGVGRSDSQLTGADFSGTSLRFSGDVNVGAFNAGASLQRWKDSSQITSVSTGGQIGWMADSGLSLGAIIDVRDMTVEYTARAIGGQTRAAEVEFTGTGLGVDVAYFGEQWNAGARFIDYSYGRSVDRVRAVLNAPTTQEFPRLQLLAESIVTRAAAAPDRELSVTLGRNFTRASLRGDWILQRDALTQVDIHSLSLTHGYRFNKHLELGTTLGFSGGDADDAIAFGGLSLTVRR
jgi:hypothetical protein